MAFRHIVITCFTCVLAAGALAAQSATPGTIQANGNATITMNPDQAQVSIGVVTTGTTAQDAAQQNATVSTTVQNAIKNVLGASGTVQTIGYSVYPRYNNATPATIVGYTANNTVLVTSYDLSIIGKLIDTANGAGANSVSGVTFGLRNPDPYVAQALTAAAKQALTYASAIASGLGARVGAVVSAQQGSSYVPSVAAPSAGASVSTPIQTGSVNVSANVTVTVQLQ
jgi:uncharacterized protein YggE